MCVITGFFIFGCNSGIVALATVSYPPDIRGSGVGSAYAVGKIGSLLAPMVGGLLLSLHWGVVQICATNAVAALLVVVVVIMALQRHLAKKSAKEQAVSVEVASRAAQL